MVARNDSCVHLNLWFFQKFKDGLVAMSRIFKASKDLWLRFFVCSMHLKVRVHMSSLLDFN
jgi:hypothetical protein